MKIKKLISKLTRQFKRKLIRTLIRKLIRILIRTLIRQLLTYRVSRLVGNVLSSIETIAFDERKLKQTHCFSLRVIIHLYSVIIHLYIHIEKTNEVPGRQSGFAILKSHEFQTKFSVRNLQHT